MCDSSHECSLKCFWFITENHLGSESETSEAQTKLTSLGLSVHHRRKSLHRTSLLACHLGLFGTSWDERYLILRLVLRPFLLAELSLSISNYQSFAPPAPAIFFFFFFNIRHKYLPFLWFRRNFLWPLYVISQGNLAIAVKLLACVWNYVVLLMLKWKTKS